MSKPTTGSGSAGIDGRRPAGDGSASAADLEWLSLDETESVLWAGSPDRRAILPAMSLLALPVLALAPVAVEPVVGLLVAATLAVVTVPIADCAVRPQYRLRRYDQRALREARRPPADDR